MDCSPRAFFPALPTPPPHNRREATPGGGGRREGAGRARSPELRGRGRRARADPPSPAPARDWLPRVGRAAPRCTAAPPCGAGAPAQADAERGAPPPPAPAAPQPPPEPRSEPPAHGSELPPSVRPLNAPQAAERAAGSSLPGFVPCDCGGSEVRANGDNASVYPRSPGNPKRRFATELSGASRGGTRCAGAGAAERWRGDTAARQRGTKLLRSRARTGAPRQPRRHQAPRPGGGTGTPRTLPPGGAALPRGREVPTVPSALPGAARRAPRPSGPARLRAAGSCREFVGSPAFPAAGPCTHQVEGGLQQEDRAPVHSLHPRRSNFPRAAFAASLFLAEHRST